MKQVVPKETELSCTNALITQIEYINYTLVTSEALGDLTVLVIISQNNHLQFCLKTCDYSGNSNKRYPSKLQQLKTQSIYSFEPRSTLIVSPVANLNTPDADEVSPLLSLSIN